VIIIQAKIEILLFLFKNENNTKSATVAVFIFRTGNNFAYDYNRGSIHKAIDELECSFSTVKQ
jgi:hypothetical protein